MIVAGLADLRERRSRAKATWPPAFASDTAGSRVCVRHQTLSADGGRSWFLNDLLRLLVSHAGKVLTHKFLLRELWGGEGDVQYLRIYVRTLRQKLEPDPEQPKLILTEQGVGYRLRTAD